MAATIRPWTPDDYTAYLQVHNGVYVDYPRTAEELRYDDEHRDPRCLVRRWLADVDGRPAGLGEVSQSEEYYDPHAFWVGVTVLPTDRRRGIGTALYETVVGALASRAPRVLRAETREDWTDGVRFLDQRGFVEELREWESRLAVAAFDPAPFAGVEAGLAARGIVIRRLTDLAADPDRDRKLQALEFELEQDVPNPETPTPIDLEQYIANRLRRPTLLPEGWLVAVDGDQYVGMTTLWASGAGSDLETGLTGVRRAYRRQGIALALKLRAIAFAQDHGAPTIKTWNATVNTGMLAINERLGFVRQPAWITAALHR